jgi:hypothetical protein
MQMCIQPAQHAHSLPTLPETWIEYNPGVALAFDHLCTIQASTQYMLPQLALFEICRQPVIKLS